MATFFIEGPDRVFEVTATPDTPGWMRREVTIRQVSGPITTDEEWGTLSRAFIKDLQGVKIKRFGFNREE